MRGDIVDQGIELMLYGMGTVVVFLVLLIVATSAMSRFLGRYFPELEESSLPDSGLAPVQPVQGLEQAPLVAIIAAAIHRHRAGRK